MNPIEKRKQTLRMNKIMKTISVCAVAMLILAAMTSPAFAVSINTKLTTEGLVGGIIDFVIKVAFYVGFVITAAGIFMFVMAYKDDNSESQSRAARMAVVGAILIGLETILKLTGLVS